MSTRQPAWAVVMRREVVAKVTDKSFVVGTLVTLALIVGMLGLQVYLSDRTKSYDVVATASSRVMADDVAHSATAADDKVRVTVRTVPDDAAARAAVHDGDADAWLHESDGAWVVTGRTQVPDALRTAAEQAVRTAVLADNAAAAGTTVEALERGSTVTVTQLVGDKDRTDLAKAVGFAMAFLFYLAAIGFGLTLAGSVVEEKQSRIVEIIAAAIPIRQLLLGKVLGNSILALAQMCLYAAVGLVGLSFTSLGGLLPGITGPIVWFVGFFAVGFLAVACLYAAAGALASRSEDLQNTSMPMTMGLVIVFLGAMLATGQWQVVLSYVPPFSAILMPSRMLQGGVPLWEPLVALAGLVAFCAVAIVVGERIYRRSLLKTGGRVSFRAAWSAAD